LNNKDFEPLRVRIMQEAYELADRNDSEGYNAVKVMCGDVQKMLPPSRTWVGLTDEEVELYWDWEDFQTGAGRSTIFEMVRNIEAKLKEKNT
jgi:hypothetical protein